MAAICKWCKKPVKLDPMTEEHLCCSTLNELGRLLKQRIDSRRARMAVEVLGVDGCARLTSEMRAYQDMWNVLKQRGLLTEAP